MPWTNVSSLSSVYRTFFRATYSYQEPRRPLDRWFKHGEENPARNFRLLALPRGRGEESGLSETGEETMGSLPLSMLPRQRQHTEGLYPWHHYLALPHWYDEDGLRRILVHILVLVSGMTGCLSPHGFGHLTVG
jgi:hypothetical protein